MAPARSKDGNNLNARPVVFHTTPVSGIPEIGVFVIFAVYGWYEGENKNGTTVSCEVTPIGAKSQNSNPNLREKPVMKIKEKETGVRHSVNPEDAGGVVEVVTLTPAEKHDLRKQEEIIEKGIDTFLDVGNALLTIREHKLYRVEFTTFEEYCRARWKFSKTHANRLIGAASVAADLGEQKILPKVEWQLRPLLGLPAAKRRKVWEKVLQVADNKAENITGTMVKKAARKISPESFRPSPTGKPGRPSKAAKAQQAAGPVVRGHGVSALVNRSDVMEAIEHWASLYRQKKGENISLLNLVQELREVIAKL